MDIAHSITVTGTLLIQVGVTHILHFGATTTLAGITTITVVVIMAVFGAAAYGVVVYGAAAITPAELLTYPTIGQDQAWVEKTALE